MKCPDIYAPGICILVLDQWIRHFAVKLSTLNTILYQSTSQPINLPTSQLINYSTNLMHPLYFFTFATF